MNKRYQKQLNLTEEDKDNRIKENLNLIDKILQKTDVPVMNNIIVPNHNHSM